MDTKQLLRKYVQTEVKPSNFVDYKQFLTSLFTLVKSKTKYSYYQYAEDLGFKRTNIMYQYMQGIRKLSATSAGQIRDAMELKGQERRYFDLMIEYCNTRKQASRDQNFQKMLEIKSQRLKDDVEKDQLAFLSEWYHPVILELIQLPGFQNDPYWIAEQIKPKIRPEQVKKSLQVLENLNLIKVVHGSIELTHNSVKTGHRVRGIGIASYHQAMLERSQEALTHAPGALRNISAMTISVNSQNYEKIRSLIHEFNEKIFAIASDTEDPDRIYQMNIQLFPFSLPTKKDEES